ncbi:MAG: hypothetical protein HYR94_15175 [Chloroflexi bacterium]|nr:hypothetical protein [Chloroflexota bacterium]
MPIMHIYQAGRKIGLEEFQHSFLIIKKDDELFWGEDKELNLRNLEGSILIWIRSVSVAPELAFLLLDWRLILDGTEVSQNQHGPIDIEGKTVDLQYNDYRFVCYFPEIKPEPGSQMAEWRAMLGKDTE